MAASDSTTDESLYPIAVLIDELKNEDVQVPKFNLIDFLEFSDIDFGGRSMRGFSKNIPVLCC